VIVAYIDSYRSRFGVEPICAVLSLCARDAPAGGEWTHVPGRHD
jgi:hypothetical protein